MALLNGEIDAIYDCANPVSYTLLDLISGDSNIDTGESAYTGNYQVCFGMEEGRVFTDKAAREASSSAWTGICCATSSTGPTVRFPVAASSPPPVRALTAASGPSIRMWTKPKKSWTTPVTWM